MDSTISEGARRQAIEDLLVALGALVAFLRREDFASDFVEDYEGAGAYLRGLLVDGVDPESVRDLDRKIRPMIKRHPHWLPPMEPDEQGRHRPPAWYVELEPLHDAVMEGVTTVRFGDHR